VARSAHEDADAWAGLVRFLESSIEMQQADRGLKELLFGDGCQAGHKFATKFTDIITVLSAVMERAKAAGQLRADVTVSDLAMIQVMLHGVGTFSASFEPDQWRRQLGILLDGLSAQHHGPTPLTRAPLPPDQLVRCACPPGAGHDPGEMSAKD
jgi:hypothetical protein